MSAQNVAIIGCGNLGLSIVEGLLSVEGLDPSTIIATRRNIAAIASLAERGVHVTENNLNAVSNARLVVLGVKPYKVQHVMEEIRDKLTADHIVVSLATGISLDELAEWAQKPLPLFRAMPNIATDIRESMTCVCGRNASNGNQQIVMDFFDQIGKSLVINEELMQAATVLGACGIAYVLRFIRAMIQGGIEIGFDAKTANAIVNQTVKGAAKLLLEKGEHPESAIDKVTTPKGCTIVGLNEMEHQGFSSSLIRGIVASHDKIGS